MCVPSLLESTILFFFHMNNIVCFVCHVSVHMCESVRVSVYLCVCLCACVYLYVSVCIVCVSVSVYLLCLCMCATLEAQNYTATIHLDPLIWYDRLEN